MQVHIHSHEIWGSVTLVPNQISPSLVVKTITLFS